MAFPFLFTGNGGRTKKKTTPNAVGAALGFPIVDFEEPYNPVRRIGAFPGRHTKKLPWDEAIAAELDLCSSGQSGSRKEVRSLAVSTLAAMNGCRGGVTRPSGRFAGYRPGYTRFYATFEIANFGFRSFWGPLPGLDTRKVGATADPRHGCAVNTAESASRLFRFTDAPEGRGGLNGWGCCARDTDTAAKLLNIHTKEG